MVLPLVCVAVVAVARGAGDPEVEFLWPGRHGDWVVPPGKKVVCMRQGPPSWPHVFRRRLRFRVPPQQCRIRITAMRRHRLSVNGVQVAPLGPQSTWKMPSAYNLGPFLQPGENRVEVRVWNAAGPPALCVEGPDTKPGELTPVCQGRWLVLGPLPMAGPDDLDRELAPERDGYRLVADRTYRAHGEAGPVALRPRPLQPDTCHGVTVLHLHRGGAGVVYAQTRIDSPTDVIGAMGIGATDGTKVWLNGRPIWSSPSRGTTRRVADPLHQCLLPLRMGANRLLVKMVHSSREARLAFRVLTPAAEPVVGFGTDQQWEVTRADRAPDWRRVWPAAHHKQPPRQWVGPLQRWPYFPLLALACGMVLLLSVLGLTGGSLVRPNTRGGNCDERCGT